MYNIYNFCYALPMTEKQAQHFKEILTIELAKIEGELSGLGQKVNGDWIAMPDEQETAESDYVDQADNVEDYESKVGKLSPLETRWNEIKRALKRIEEGTYGICLKSGQPIEMDRLEANPAAETCKAMMNAR